MSTATIPLQNRPGFFPGATASPLGSTSNYDYIDLTDIDGDSGLREAYRIWWLLEQVTFTPSGTVTIGAASRSFSQQFIAPDSTAGSDILLVSGSIIGASQSGSTSPVSPQEPATRSARGSGLFIPGVVDSSQSWIYGPNDAEGGTIKLVIQQVSGQWRLYYQFVFNVDTRDVSPPSASLNIVNTSQGSITPIATGTASFAGYSLGWKAYTSGAGASASGIDLTASDVFWTF